MRKNTTVNANVQAREGVGKFGTIGHVTTQAEQAEKDARRQVVLTDARKAEWLKVHGFGDVDADCIFG